LIFINKIKIKIIEKRNNNIILKLFYLFAAKKNQHVIKIMKWYLMIINWKKEFNEILLLREIIYNIINIHSKWIVKLNFHISYIIFNSF